MGAFNQTGTSHLFVISGLHIGMVAGLCFWLVSALLWLSPGVSGRLPRQKLAACAALLYSLLAGFTLPTQRLYHDCHLHVCLLEPAAKPGVVAFHCGIELYSDIESIGRNDGGLLVLICCCWSLIVLRN